VSPDERGEEELDGGGGAGAEARAPAIYFGEAPCVAAPSA